MLSRFAFSKKLNIVQHIYIYVYIYILLQSKTSVITEYILSTSKSSPGSSQYFFLTTSLRFSPILLFHIFIIAGHVLLSNGQANHGWWSKIGSFQDKVFTDSKIGRKRKGRGRKKSERKVPSFVCVGQTRL